MNAPAIAHFFSRTKRLLFPLLLLGSAVSGLARDQQRPLTPNSELLAEFRRYHQWTNGASPDGKWAHKLAAAGDSNSEYGADVWSLSDGHVRTSFRTREPVGRFVWRPDSRALSYFAQSSNNLRRLFVWDLEADRHREIPIPASYAQALIKWSPDSRLLAFTSDQGGLVIVDTGSGRVVSALRELAILSFDWAGDSLHLAAITDEGENALSIIGADTGELAEKIEVSVDATELKEVAWQGSRSFLVLAEKRARRSKLPSETTLYALDREKGAATELQRSSSKLINGVSWLPEQRYVWHEREADGTQSILIGQIGSAATKRFSADGTLNFRAFLPGTRTLVAAFNSLKENALYTFSFDQSSPPVALIGSECPACPNSTHERVALSDAAGQKIPLLLSRAAKDGKYANAAIIRLHGGTPTTNGWEQTQLTVNHGVHALHLVIREPTATADLLQACDYAHDTLGIPRERIVIMGASTSSRFVLEACIAAPDKFGLAVVIGVGNPPRIDRPSQDGNVPRIFAFHGENDRTIAPLQAKAVIEKALGNESLLPPKGMWHVFAGEDHSLRRIESHATIYSLLLSELGAYPRAQATSVVR